MGYDPCEGRAELGVSPHGKTLAGAVSGAPKYDPCEGRAKLGVDPHANTLTGAVGGTLWGHDT